MVAEECDERCALHFIFCPEGHPRASAGRLIRNQQVAGSIPAGGSIPTARIQIVYRNNPGRSLRGQGAKCAYSMPNSGNSPGTVLASRTLRQPRNLFDLTSRTFVLFAQSGASARIGRALGRADAFSRRGNPEIHRVVRFLTRCANSKMTAGPRASQRPASPLDVNGDFFAARFFFRFCPSASPPLSKSASTWAAAASCM